MNASQRNDQNQGMGYTIPRQCHFGAEISFVSFGTLALEVVLDKVVTAGVEVHLREPVHKLQIAKYRNEF